MSGSVGGMEARTKTTASRIARDFKIKLTRKIVRPKRASNALSLNLGHNGWKAKL
jgi:hypothetical protein